MTVSLILNSCKKAEVPLIEAIIGKWDVESVMQIYYVDNVKKTSMTYFFESGDMSFEFTENGTGTYYENSEALGAFTWTLTGTALTINGSSDSLVWDLTYDKNMLSWTFSQTETSDSAEYKYEFYYTAVRAE